MKAQQIKLYIDELVLHGFDVHDQYGVGVALESELQRLFAEQGIPPSLGKGGIRPDLQSDGANLNSKAGADVIGAHIAQSIYGGMNK